jgi:hypothetical protein
MRSRGAGTSVAGLLQDAAIGLLALVTVGLCVLAVRHVRSADGVDDPPSSTSTSAGGASGSTTPPAPGDGSAPGDPPRVEDQRRADFGRGDALPDGAEVFNSSAGLAMRVEAGALTQTGTAASAAASYLETRLSTPVRKLGATIRFPAATSGAAALIVSPQSVVTAGQSGSQLPDTGLRLVVQRGGWRLLSGPDRVVVSQVEFDLGPRSTATVQILREGATVWITSPAGTTSVQAPLAESLSGPWACWALLENGAGQVPAGITRVWAG